MMKFAVLLAVLRTLTSAHATTMQKPGLAWILLKSRLEVMSGIFSGMKYIGASAGSALFPKLLGTYEIELEEILDSVITRQPDVIVDAGAAEGYFAVGLAVKCPTACVSTYDVDLRACYYLDVLAKANKVEDRISIHWQACTQAALQSDLKAGQAPFLLMDVEGAEEHLLDPAEVPALSKTEILVELHEDSGRQDLATPLSDRFEKTHAIRIIDSRPRSSSDLPVSFWPFRKTALAAMNEGREAGQRWLHFAPKAR